MEGIMSTVVVIGTGEMGAAVARRLREQGAAVRTSLRGRGAASRARVERAQVTVIDDDARLVDGADVVLSIVPPGQAPAVAAQFAPVLAGAESKPAFVDCNAVAPASVRAIAATMAPSGCVFVDGGIIGGPPGKRPEGPKFYVSGPAEPRVDALRGHGLDIRRVDGPVGAASALKMAYAGIGKGLTALGAAMILGAEQAGVAAALHAELADSQPTLHQYLTKRVPDMYPKAYRWVAEMEEIATFMDGAAGADMYRGAAALFAAIAKEFADQGTAIATLQAFVDKQAA
jgi:3-hydroxyisobutyrate dehydrogenase-like beta-hydroxyacid dehydrogenase